MADAVGSSFSDAVAHTSLIGAVILGVGTVLVAFLLPRKGNGHPGEAPERAAEEQPELTGAATR
jgi:hypothetical protein